LHDRLGTTTVYVRHDQIEAMTLGQRVAVMRDGRIQQVDAPQALYAHPTNLYVAAFIGSPSMNLVEATVTDGAVEFADFRIPLDRQRLPSSTRGGAVVLGIRPESIEDAAFAEPGLPQVEVAVEVVEDLGSDAHVIFRVDAPRVETEDVRAAAEEADETLLADEPVSLFTARVDPKTSAHVGAKLTLAVDPAAFHFFDPVSGENVTGREDARVVA